MKEAALKVYASLSANDEDIRKKVIETEGLMNILLCSISNGNSSVQLAAVRCLHSLSRSVQTLRTTFQVRITFSYCYSYNFLNLL